ncbi:MAG: DUF493 family protein [Proteobacteria bacterium]|nr:DUF493 family protein [Pseudomonadota bacterium]
MTTESAITSQQQLDAIYRDISGHTDVLMAL